MALSRKVNQVSAVIATWCPHCYPLSVENSQKLAEELGAKCKILDIDNPIDSRTADEMVQQHGDYTEDYLIPQIFLEFDDNSVQHLFTGFSENTEVTKRHWADLFNSEFVRDLKRN